MKLEWQEDAPKNSMNWDEAIEYAKSLGDGWRLPTRGELCNAFDNFVDGFKENYYWSSSTYALSTGTAWSVHFNSGSVNFNVKPYFSYVRCVREIGDEPMNAKEEIEILTKIKHIEVELSELKASLSLPLNSMSLKEFYKNTVIELNSCKYFNNQAVIDKYCKLYADEVMKEEQSKLKRWEPYKTGYYIDINNFVWAYETDNSAYGYPNKNNLFKTKELAKLRAKQREAEDELFNIWEHLVGDWRPDWNDNKAKYYVFFTKDRREQIYAASDLIILPIYRYFPNDKMAMRQYELASDHARAYMEGQF